MWTEQTVDPGEATTLRVPSTKHRFAVKLKLHRTLHPTCCRPGMPPAALSECWVCSFPTAAHSLFEVCPCFIACWAQLVMLYRSPPDCFQASHKQQRTTLPAAPCTSPTSACLAVQNALGPQSLSTLPSSPISGFGTAKRPSMATKSGVPGPGAYKLKNTVGQPQWFLYLDLLRLSATKLGLCSLMVVLKSWLR